MVAARLNPMIIADAGPIIALAKVNELEILTQLFSTVALPEAVYFECTIKACLDATRIQQFVDANKVEICKVSQSELLIHQFSLSLGLGEKSALALAISNPDCLLVVDDFLARKSASKFNINFIGTVRLLHMAEKRGLINSAEFLVNEMSEQGYRISKKILIQIKEEDN